MNKIISKPHLYFFGLIPIFLIIGFFKRDIPIDIDISYIHYLINVDFWCYITAVYFGLMGVNYLSLYWVKKHPNKWLTIGHIFLQTICVLPYLYAVFNLDESGNLTNYAFFTGGTFTTLLFISFFIFLLSILVHLLNFFSSLLLKRE